MTDMETRGSDLYNNEPSQSSHSEIQPQTKLDSLSASIPAAMSADSSHSKRPRDSRLLHVILANLGVTGYQERVPLQLMDFAYRYTSSTLQDALHLTSEGYGTTSGSGTGKAANNADLSSVTLSSLRLSISSRTHYQFSPTLPKDFYIEVAQERNQVQLPTVGRNWGLRLPPEQYCLTGIGWKLKEQWQSEGNPREVDKGGDESMLDPGEENGGGGEDTEEGYGAIEDIFGGEMNGEDRDQAMEEA